MTTIQQFGGRTMQFTKIHTPEIMAISGAAGVIVAAVLAARATLKLEKLVEKLEGDREAAHDLYADNQIDDKQLAKELFKAQRNFVLGLVKLYGIPASIGAASIGLMLGGQGVLKKRNVALLGAYSGLEQAYNEYRKRVIEEVGEEKEAEIRLNLRAMQAEEVREGDNDDKPMALLSEQELKMQALGASPYAVFYDRYSTPLFSQDSDYNLTTLRAQQRFANDLLKSRGYIFLNDIFEALELPKTQAGQFVGWTFDSKGNEGSNFVDFGLDNFENVRRGAHLNGDDDGGILLDFNVEGEIISKVWKK